MTAQKELLELASFIEKEEKIKPIKIVFKNLRGPGRANYIRRGISIPNWMFEDKYSDEFRYYYIIHEVCHIILFDKFGYSVNHEPVFKEMEKKYLDVFGLEIEYKKAYPKRLYSNGVVFYESKPRKRRRRYPIYHNGSQH